ncbi:MAG: hypothetical protein IIA20_05385 [Thaumarchaeota archaeon]|nr:hypothetical protein [Nitrososphaerota archaeon]
MFIKLAIIGSILLVGVIIFPNITDITINDLEKIKDDAIQKTGTTIEEGGKLVNNQVKDFTESSTERISESINDFSESTLQTTGIAGILGNDQNKNNNESLTQRDSSSTKTGSSVSKKQDDSSSTTSPFSTITTESQAIQTFETLSLTSSQQLNDNVMLRYEDTSGKTISVTVTLRTTEKELFTGIFYSSMFETFVQDVTKTSYFIDMIIEHKEYGTISSSVFIPVDNPNTIINGVFSKS